MANIGDATTEQETDANTAQGYVARAYAARHATSGLGRTTIRRRQPGAHDVQIDILFCGVCHSDLHQVRNEWSEAGIRQSTRACLDTRSSGACRRLARAFRSSRRVILRL